MAQRLPVVDTDGSIRALFISAQVPIYPVLALFRRARLETGSLAPKRLRTIHKSLDGNAGSSCHKYEQISKRLK